jgi:hypothetical protein
MKLVLFALTSGFLSSGALAQGTPPAGCCATAAMLRFECSRLTIERLDPLVNPGMVGTPHNHQIVGGNAFNASMPAVEYDPAQESTCTSCTFSEDFSNYWTANLYFQARNGTFKRVPQLVNLGLRGREGITVYYIPPYDGKTKVTAFKKVSGGPIAHAASCSPQSRILSKANPTRAFECWSAMLCSAKPEGNRNSFAIDVLPTSSKIRLEERLARATILLICRCRSAGEEYVRPLPSRRAGTVPQRSYVVGKNRSLTKNRSTVIDQVLNENGFFLKNGFYVPRVGAIGLISLHFRSRIFLYTTIIQSVPAFYPPCTSITTARQIDLTKLT